MSQSFDFTFPESGSPSGIALCHSNTHFAHAAPWSTRLIYLGMKSSTERENASGLLSSFSAS